MISSILPRLNNPRANDAIARVNAELQKLENDHISLLDNTLDFLYRNQPNTNLFMDHVHINNIGTKILSGNIVSISSTLHGIQPGN